MFTIWCTILLRKGFLSLTTSSNTFRKDGCPPGPELHGNGHTSDHTNSILWHSHVATDRNDSFRGEHSNTHFIFKPINSSTGCRKITYALCCLCSYSPRTLVEKCWLQTAFGCIFTNRLSKLKFLWYHLLDEPVMAIPVLFLSREWIKGWLWNIILQPERI